MRKPRGGVLVATAAAIALAALSCGDDDEFYGDSEVTGVVAGFSLCKQFTSAELGRAAAADVAANRAAVEYEYDRGDTLRLTHVNAGMNCCPGEILADVAIHDGTIEISERERESGCRCNCLYDVDFEIRNVSIGAYTIHIVEPYLPPGNEPLEFRADLVSNPTGTYTTERRGYPWSD